MIKKIIATTIGLSMMMMLFPGGAQGLTAAELQVQIDALLAQIADLQTQLADLTDEVSVDVPAACVGITFDRNLSLGSTGDDVKCLQALLNTDADTQVAETGAGSPGEETSYFGPLTRAAAINFQEKHAAEILTPLGLTAGTGFVGPSTRAKLNAMLEEVDEEPVDEEPVDEEPVDEEPVDEEPVDEEPVVEEGLTVALSADTPAAGTLIAGQGLGTLAKYTFTNGDADAVKVTQVKLRRLGVSADSTLADVYLYDGATRLTDGASVSSGYVTFVNSAGIFSLAAGASKTITVRSTIAADTSGQTVGVQMESIVSGASAVQGTFPFAGNLFSIASKPANFATVSFATLTYPSSAATIDPQDDYTIWQNTVTVGNYKVNFNRISLRMIGSIDKTDLENFRLYVDGTLQGSAVANLDAEGYVTFDLSASSVELRTGNRVIKVVADIIGGSYKDFTFSLRRASDASFVDAQYGEEVLPTLPAAAAFTARETGKITISTGTITLTKMTDSPSGNVVIDGTAALLAKFQLKAAGEAVKIETLRVAVNASSSTTTAFALRNGYLLADETQVGSTAAINEDSNTTLAYTSYTTNLTVTPGSPVTLEIYADIYDSGNTASLVANDTVRIDIVAHTGNAQGLVSLQMINVPGTLTSGNTLNVVSGTISLSKYAAYTDRTMVSPATAYKLGHFTLTGNSTEAVILSDLKVQFTSGTTTPAKLTNVYVVYGTQTSAVKATVATTTNDTTSQELSWAINHDLAKAGSIEVKVYATIGEAITDGSFTATAKFTGQTKDSGQTVYSGASGADAYVTGQTITLGTGAFVAALDAGTPLTQLVAGNQTVPTALYKFTATNDSFTIDELKIEIASGAEKAVTHIKLLDGETVLGTLAPDGSRRAHFTGLDVDVAANTSKVLTVQLVLGEISADYDQSGVDLKTTLVDDSVKYLNSSGVSAQDQPDGNVDGKNIYVYQAVPTMSKVDLTGTVTNGSAMDLYRFTAAAPSVGGAGLYKVTLGLAWSTSTVNAPSIGTFKFYLGTTELTAAGLATTTVSTATEGITSIVFTFPAGISVGAGETYSFTFRATPAGFDPTLAATAKDVLSIWLKDDDAYTASVAAASVSKNFVWSDLSALNHSVSTEDWTGGYMVGDLPLDAQSWSR